MTFPEGQHQEFGRDSIVNVELYDQLFPQGVFSTLTSWAIQITEEGRSAHPALEKSVQKITLAEGFRTGLLPIAMKFDVTVTTPSGEQAEILHGSDFYPVFLLPLPFLTLLQLR